MLAGELTVGEVLVEMEDEEGIELRRVGQGLGVLNVGLGEIGGGKLRKGLLAKGVEAGCGQQQKRARDRSGRMADPVDGGRISPGQRPEKGPEGLRRGVGEITGIRYGGEDSGVVRFRGKKMHPLGGIRHHIS